MKQKLRIVLKRSYTIGELVDMAYEEGCMSMKGKPPQNGGPFYSRSVNGQRPSTPRPRKKTADELATQREMDAIFGEMNREHGNPVPPPKKKKKGFIRRLLGR